MKEEKEEQQQQKKDTGPRTKEMQETINHLILGITMWISTSVTCLTTLLSVHQPWCLLALVLPFVYTMFPQILKFTTAVQETAYLKYKARREEKQEAKLVEKEPKKESKKESKKEAKKESKAKEKVPVSLEDVRTEDEKVEVQL